MKPFNKSALLQITNKREAKFAQFLTTNKHQWQYHSRSFSFGSPPELYTPDFYVPTQNMFYEVLGSRQALHQNHKKIARFLHAFPKIRFRFVNPTGEVIPYRLTPDRVIIRTPTGRWSHLNGAERNGSYTTHPAWKRLRILAYENQLTLMEQLTVLLDSSKAPRI